MKTHIEIENHNEQVSLSIRIEAATTVQSAFAEIGDLCRNFSGHAPEAGLQPKQRHWGGPDNANQVKCALDQFLDWLRGCGPLKKHEIKLRSMERFGVSKSKFYTMWTAGVDAGMLEQLDGRWHVKAGGSPPGKESLSQTI
jgi:hypothetical protein